MGTKFLIYAATWWTTAVRVALFPTGCQLLRGFFFFMQPMKTSAYTMGN
jgi:hypothetical protein